jgi:hypothetical protein
MPISRSQARAACSTRTRRNPGMAVIRGAGVRPTKVWRPSQNRTVRSTRMISPRRPSRECRPTASAAVGGGPTAASPRAAAAMRSCRRVRPGPTRSGWASASRLCRAAPSRTVVSSRGGAPAAGRKRPTTSARARARARTGSAPPAGAAAARRAVSSTRATADAPKGRPTCRAPPRTSGNRKSGTNRLGVTDARAPTAASGPAARSR